MRDHVGQLLKALSLILAAVLVYQLVQVGRRMNPLARVTIPALPKLASDTNAPDAGKGMTNSTSVSKGTNAVGTTNAGALKGGTNLPVVTATNSMAANSTNVPAVEREKGSQRSVDAGSLSNSTAVMFEAASVKSPNSAILPTAETVKALTNHSSEVTTNNSSEATVPIIPPILATQETNLSSAALSGTNFPRAVLHRTNAESGTNLVKTSAPGTNRVSGLGSNSPVRSARGTNSPPLGMAMAGMNPSAMRGGAKPVELAPEIKARVDRIYESELFGPVQRPTPIGLLGIAGNSAILRSSSGQTGLVKEGDSLGDLKLLRIGMNRVLVEQDGKKTELMIFEGLGGQSLMPKDKETSK